VAAGRTAIFVDGAYFDFMLREEFGATRIDYERLSVELAGGADVLRTYYYHCPPYQSATPTVDERERQAKFDKFHHSLQSIPRYEVRLGKLEFRGTDGTGRPRFEQKRVDILLGVDLTRLAAKGQITEAILLAGDSDFLPAVAAAKDDGVLVRLFHGRAPHSDLRLMADERTQIDVAFIEKVKRK
jgi:uncharacterized LabA/DUF88 family protein